MNSLLFHPLQGMTQDEAQSANVREFKGNGTPYLPVPGLLDVTGVRIGTQEIPLTLRQKFPESASNFAQKYDVELPLIQLVHDTNGQPILLRSQQSNNGVWQEGVTIYVAGEWDEKKRPATKAEQL